MDLIPGLGRVSWSKKWQPTLVFLPEKFYGQRSPGGYSPWGRKESDMTEQLSTHASYLQFLQLFDAFPSTPYSVLSGRCTF